MSGEKQSEIDLDLKDRRILYELDLDARQPATQIAKKIGLSKQAVHHRIDRLVKNGVINQFVMVLDTQKLGYCFYDLFLQLQNMTKEKEAEMLDFLKSMNTVGWMCKTMGKWDLIIAIFTRDVKEFNNSLSQIFNKYGEYIKDKTFIIDTDAIICKNKYLFEEKGSHLRKDDAYGDDSPANLDDKDVILLRTLDTNPRMSLLGLSRKTEISFDTVRRKIKRMTDEGVIQGFKIKINPMAFGYEWHVLLLELNIVNDKQKQEFTRFLQNHKNVIFIINTIGNWNMMLDLHLKDFTHFQEFLSEIQENFDHMIKSHEHLTVTKEYKTTYVPEAIMKLSKKK